MLVLLSQASKDAARYPVAAKVADLLVRDIVSIVSSFYFQINSSVGIHFIFPMHVYVYFFLLCRE